MSNGLFKSYRSMLKQRGFTFSDVHQKIFNAIDYYAELLTLPIIPMKYFEMSFNKFGNVKKVETISNKNYHDVRIYVDGNNWAEEEKIYEKYSELLNELPEVDFEVHVIELHGRDPSEISYPK